MTDIEESPGSGKKHETVVYVSNLSEDVWPFIEEMSDPVARESEIEENATSLADRDLFTLSGEEHVIFITPRPVSQEFLGYFRELTGRRDFEILPTRQHTGEISKDILRDPHIMAKLIEAANSSKKLTMISYTTSYQFLHLTAELKNRGLTIYTPESPDKEDAWTVNFYGSKAGIRQLAGQSVAKEPDFIMPDGLICFGIEDAARIAAKWFLKNHGVVIKTNKGHSGAGLLIYRPGDLPEEFHDAEKVILGTLKRDSYWNKFPIVIEDFIAVGTSVGGGFPNVEFQVQKNGHVNFLYYCGLRVTEKGVFKGIEIHEDVLSDKVAAQITDTGFFIAEQYAAAGYHGYFDLDYIAAKNGKLYVTESNVRRTGGTHVYHTAKRLIGDDFMHEVYTLSNNLYDLPTEKRFTFEDIMNRLEPVLFLKSTGEGVVIISENVLSRGQIGYIVFGRTKKRAVELEEKMERLLTE